MSNEMEQLISDLITATDIDQKLDERVARALGYRIAATTRGPHIMREGSVMSWTLPFYSATPESRLAAIEKLKARAKESTL